MSIIVPELIIKACLDGALGQLDLDIKTSQKDESYLFRLFGDLEYNRFRYYDQAKNIFDKSNGKSRQVRTKSGYDGDLSQPPIIFITSSKDTYKFSQIGMRDEEYWQSRDKTQTPANNCRFSAESSIVIVSDQIEELALIYNVIRSLLISIGETLSLSGIENLKLGGADITLDETMIPKAVFMKALSLSYEYEIKVPSMVFATGGVTGFEIESDKPVN